MGSRRGAEARRTYTRLCQQLPFIQQAEYLSALIARAFPAPPRLCANNFFFAS